jgi:hypothetical protein
MPSVVQEYGLLNGPYPVLELDYWTRSNAAGVFVVRGENGSPERVGCSVHDVRSAIKDAAEATRASLFSVEYEVSEARMAFMSALLFHALQLASRQDHPQLGQAVDRCPIAGCTFRP